MGAVLGKPITSQLLQRKGNKKYMVGASEMQGFRINMEDQMQISCEMPSHPKLAVYGVFDGHAGERASLMLSKELILRLDALSDPTNEQQLSECVQKMDADFLKKEDEREDGSTCVFAIVEQTGDDEFEITAVNVGDSRVVLIREDGTTEGLTEDHKPENEEESQRIMLAGGRVHMNRVDGQLAMSRAIGDWQYKQDASKPLNKQKVIAVPDIQKTKTNSKSILLVCCDGIVEQLTNEEVGEFLYDLETKRKTEGEDKDPAMFSKKLLDYSLAKGSKDNHSAIVIYFEDGCSYQREKEFQPGPFNPYKADKQFEKAYLEDALRHGYKGEELEEMVRKAEEGMDIEAAGDDGIEGMGGGFGAHLQQAVRMLTQQREGENGSEGMARLKALLGMGAQEGGEEGGEDAA